MDNTCINCGGLHLNWRVSRSGGPQFRHGPRMLVWTCRQCAFTWTEPVAADRHVETKANPGRGSPLHDDD